MGKHCLEGRDILRVRGAERYHSKFLVAVFLFLLLVVLYLGEGRLRDCER